MKPSKRKIRFISRLVLAGVLFAQGTLAAHACVQPAASAVRSLSNEHAVATMHCHEPAKVNANECLMHCTQSDQINLDQHDMAALPVNEVVLQVATRPLKHNVPTFVDTPLVLNTGPPLSIRFCSFLL